MGMKQVVLDALVGNRLVWAVLRRTVVRFSQALLQHRGYRTMRTRWIDVPAAARTLAPDGKVRNGPFAGMRYPQMESAGSSLFPKLLGCYERELHPWIEAGDGRGYRAVVNIGCAEGYYSVGLALRWPQIQVYAFDIDARARRLSEELARSNGVSARVHIGAACNAAALRALPLPTRSLIISDCEGYESPLFDEDTIGALREHDFLIELHDWYDVTISTTLKHRFAATHDVQAVYSVDDVQKVHAYDYPELSSWTPHDRRALLSEWRPYVMEWIYCRSRAVQVSSI